MNNYHTRNVTLPDVYFNLRKYYDENFFIALNFSSNVKKIHAGERGQWRVMFSTHRTPREHFASLTMTLSPYEATVVMRIGEL